MSDGYEVELDKEINSLDNFIKDLGAEQGNQAVRKIALGVLSDAVLNTPWVSGLMRNNWRVSRNVRNKNLFEANTSPTAPVNRAQNDVSKIKENDTVYIENNVEYADSINKLHGGILENAIRRGLSGI